MFYMLDGDCWGVLEVLLRKRSINSFTENGIWERKWEIEHIFAEGWARGRPWIQVAATHVENAARSGHIMESLRYGETARWGLGWAEGRYSLQGRDFCFYELSWCIWAFNPAARRLATVKNWLIMEILR